MTAKFEITVLNGSSAGDVFRFDIERIESLTIGTGSDNTLVLQEPGIARRHVKIESIDGKYRLCDLGGESGTWLMGFKLNRGEEHARVLNNGDEFKIGGILFRVKFEDSESSPDAGSDPEQLSAPDPRLQKVQQLKSQLVETVQAAKDGDRRARKHLLIAAVAVFGILFFLFAPTTKKSSGLPAQLSSVPLSFPQYKVLGYYKAGRKAEERDVRHADKVQFLLPVSDLLVEYDYRSETDIDVFVDSAPLKRLEKHTYSWQRQAIILRDPQKGAERRLIFDNLDYPRKAGGRMKQWGIRNVRVTPLTDVENLSFDKMLSASQNLVGSIDRRPDSLYNALRAVQKTIAKGLLDANATGVLYVIDPNELIPESRELHDQLKEIESKRASARIITAADKAEHLDQLVRMTALLDGELWRRFDNRTNFAQRAGKAKNYIEAHDTLVAVKLMFPGALDYRWELAEQLFQDKKVVSKKVRKSPEKYRRKALKASEEG